MHIYADQINQVALSNGNLRLQLSQRYADERKGLNWGPKNRGQVKNVDKPPYPV